MEMNADTTRMKKAPLEKDGQVPKKTGTKKVLRIGVVDSISGNKTVRVVVENLTKHPLYGKYVRRRSKLLAHDENTKAGLGDTVEVTQCRPISKRKSWRLVRVVRTAAGATVES